MCDGTRILAIRVENDTVSTWRSTSVCLERLQDWVFLVWSIDWEVEAFIIVVRVRVVV